MPSEKEALIAIDVLLDPDATMLSKAEATNARLRENFPKGYALDALHAPHISVLQRQCVRVISSRSTPPCNACLRRRV